MAIDPADLSRGDGWTVDDYMEMEDEEGAYELLRGELVVNPGPNLSHQEVVAQLGTKLVNHVEAHDLGKCYYGPTDIVLADDTVVQPDIVFVAADRFDELYDGHGLTGGPDLAVEVLSPATASRDRIRKRELYAEAGVAWFVLVDPDDRTVEVFELGDDGRYAVATSGAEDDALTIGRFPEMEIRLGELWLEVE